ncbi:MAG: adenylate/guanylate cyclase domain-containing protein [Myxococcota bacterium]|nr:adenylate/guanylate cyclase domain-containing protein [Myxococcota bacterium]
MTDPNLVNSLQKQLNALLKFPDQNPNPVLKTDSNGIFLYANAAGKEILTTWGIAIGDQAPAKVVDWARNPSRDALEMPVGNKTFSFHIVPVPEFDFVNIYGTDVTAMKAITKFPDQNPNPVLKTDSNGIFLYANAAGKEILRAWSIFIGESAPSDMVERTKNPSDDALEMPVGNKTFSFHIVPVPEFDFVNIYGTDVTAMKAITKFPDQNPNPVLKTNMQGIFLYANAAGKNILTTWGIAIGEQAPAPVVERAQNPSEDALEIPVGNKTFSLYIVPVPEFDFVNIYGTDVTAMKAITKFPDQNPNPVLKIDMQGRLMYSNQGGKPIQDHWDIQVGEAVPSQILEHAQSGSSYPLEIEVAAKTYLFHIVPVPEFSFINIYGTDITAAKDNEQILIKLAKYFSPQVYESIFSGDLEVKIQTKRKRLTVFFSDIKGFSEITERLEPEVLTDLITDYLTTMTNIAVKHGGTVDKYIGDAIMVFFGDPKSNGAKEDALACVRMALEMKEALWKIRQTWRDKGISQPLNIRIGIHTDTCTVGNFGSHDRLDYTTIGNGVNLASRLESNARANQILISEDTYLLIREKITCDKLDKITVKNIRHPIQTYEVRGSTQDLIKELNQEMDGFSLFIDPSKRDDMQHKKELLERALNLLNRLN